MCIEKLMPGVRKKFVFVNLSIKCAYTGVNHGIAYLAAVLKRHSIDVSCINIQSEISPQEFIRAINDLAPSIVGFSCTTNQQKFMSKYSLELAKDPCVLQIAGGAGPTLDPEWFLLNSGVNGVCVGEAETSLSNLLNNIETGRDIYDTEGFYWIVNNKIKKNKASEFTEDISTLDFPDYSVFNRRYVVGDGVLHVVLSRGCPYNCHYCCNKAIARRSASPDSHFRMPSVGYSIRLLEELIAQYPETRAIAFDDDLLIADQAWFQDFAIEFDKKIKIPYRVSARPESINTEIVKALKSSGCYYVLLGLESGNEQLRAELLNRTYTNRLLVEKARLIKSSGIHLFTFNITGFPFETDQQREETFELNKMIEPDSGICSFFYPYKHTALYEICREKGMLRDENEMLAITDFSTVPAIKMSVRQYKKCLRFQAKLMRYFIWRHTLAETKHMPLGIRKCCMYAQALIYKTPVVFKFVRWFYNFLPTSVKAMTPHYKFIP